MDGVDVASVDGQRGGTVCGCSWGLVWDGDWDGDGIAVIWAEDDVFSLVRR